jgi:hypothetical protein
MMDHKLQFRTYDLWAFKIKTIHCGFRIHPGLKEGFHEHNL